jgi:hypothetical protein
VWDTKSINGINYLYISGIWCHSETASFLRNIICYLAFCVVCNNFGFRVRESRILPVKRKIVKKVPHKEATIHNDDHHCHHHHRHYQRRLWWFIVLRNTIYQFWILRILNATPRRTYLLCSRNMYLILVFYFLYSEICPHVIGMNHIIPVRWEIVSLQFLAAHVTQAIWLNACCHTSACHLHCNGRSFIAICSKWHL